MESERVSEAVNVLPVGSAAVEADNLDNLEKLLENREESLELVFV